MRDDTLEAATACELEQNARVVGIVVHDEQRAVVGANNRAVVGHFLDLRDGEDGHGRGNAGRSRVHRRRRGRRGDARGPGVFER
jgi:hypothetical protein